MYLQRQAPQADQQRDAAHKFPREEIHIVVCARLHVDHVGWNTMKVGEQWLPTFSNARYLIDQEEFEYWSADESEEQVPVMARSITPIFEPGLADLVEMGHILSPEFRLMLSPGHTLPLPQQAELFAAAKDIC